MTEPLHLSLDRLQTPIGEMLIVTGVDGHLRAIAWADHELRMQRLLERHYGPRGFTLSAAPAGLPSRCALEAYFSGDLSAIDGLPVKPEGTVFQQRVWNALRTIPCGTTISYAQLAGQIGAPAAVRAVGLANGANPVGVVIPCHRVIGADGSLTGYGGGTHRKSWLLSHESCARPAQAQGTLF